MIRRLDRYILRELLGPFLLGILILTSILIMQRILGLMEMVLDKGVDLLSVGELFLRLLPAFFVITLPMAVLMSTVTTFNRLSADNEIIAFYAGGIGFFRLLRPVVMFSILVGLLTLSMGFNAGQSKGTIKNLAEKMLLKRASIGLEARQFNGAFPDMTIYVDAMPTFSELEGIFIYDQRNPEQPAVIVAKRGVLVNDEASKTISLRLADGSLQQGGGDKGGYQRIVFAQYDLKIDLGALMEKREASERPSYADIQERIAKSQGEDLDALGQLVDFYKQFLFSLAAFVFCILGMPLGILSGRIARMGGVVAGVAIILLYYMLMVLGDYLVSIRIVSPLVAAALPILVFIPIGLSLLMKVSNQASPSIFGMRSKRI